MDDLKTESEATTRREASAVKRLVIFFWRGLGMPGAWVLLMVAAMIADLGSKNDLSFIVFSCLFSYFLSRIARAVEKIAGI